MVQFLLTLLALAVMAIAGAVFGGLYPDTFHPHAWIGPCAIAKRLGPAGAIANPTFPDDLRWSVVDGDTLKCEQRKVQIVGYDAPETSLASGAKCDGEVAAGKRATARVKQLLSTRSWSASTDGVSSGPDSWGRFRIRLYIGNKDLKDILIGGGLAKSWDGEGAKPNWCLGDK